MAEGYGVRCAYVGASPPWTKERAACERGFSEEEVESAGSQETDCASCVYVLAEGKAESDPIEGCRGMREVML